MLANAKIVQQRWECQDRCVVKPGKIESDMSAFGSIYDAAKPEPGPHDLGHEAD